MEVPSVSCVSHTSAAAHEGLLSQCSVTHSPANTRKYKLCFNKIKKPIKEQLGCRYFVFQMQLYYPGKY